MIPGLFLNADHSAGPISTLCFKKRHDKAFAIGSDG